MSVRKKHLEKNILYFCTITCYDWIPLFDLTNYYLKIYYWFDILKSKGIKITGYVIMPNHLHIILFIPRKSNTIDKILGNWKRFMAYDIVKILNANRQFKLLNRLQLAVLPSEKQKGKIHQVFTPSFDVKLIESGKFLLQKLNYIHMNPVAKKWHLVEDFILYPYSSAGFYFLDDYKGYIITHYDEIYND